MNSIQRAIKKLQSYQIEDEDNLFFTNILNIQDAIDILEEFEVDLVNELTCEQLQLKQDGFKYIS